MGEKSAIPTPQDKAGNIVRVGARVRLLSLSGEWLDGLPADERQDVHSMIGGIFEVKEIDEYGRPWIEKWWPGDRSGTCRGHSVALDSSEMELVDEAGG